MVTPKADAIASSEVDAQIVARTQALALRAARVVERVGAYARKWNRCAP